MIMVVAVMKLYQSRYKERALGNILWIFPDDRQVTVRVDNVLSFARALPTFHEVSIADISYTVRHTELIMNVN